MLSTILVALAIVPTASGSYVILPQQVESNGITYNINTQNSKLIAIPLNKIKPQIRISHQVKTTPQPILEETPIGSDYKSQIQYWCSFYGCNPNTVHKVMMCESTGNMNAYNRSGASGIMQFMPSTISAYGNKIGISNPNAFNVKDSLQIASYMFATGNAYHWKQCL